jgi:hypothetical protein
MISDLPWLLFQEQGNASVLGEDCMLFSSRAHGRIAAGWVMGQSLLGRLLVKLTKVALPRARPRDAVKLLLSDYNCRPIGDLSEAEPSDADGIATGLVRAAAELGQPKSQQRSN